MAIIITSREFNQGSSSALKVAETEPVYITKRGKITNVILSYTHYQQIVPQQRQTAAEFFNGSNELATISDDIFDIPRDIESWGFEEHIE